MDADRQSFPSSGCSFMTAFYRQLLRALPWICLAAKDVSDPERTRAKGKPTPVRTALVSEAQVEQIVGATAMTVPSETIPIVIGESAKYLVSEVRLRDVHVREGDFVHKGDLLFVQEDKESKQRLIQAQSAFDYAEVDLTRIKEQVSYNQKLRELMLAKAEALLLYRKEALDYLKKADDVVQELFKAKSASVLEMYDAITKHAQARYEISDAEREIEKARIEMVLGDLKDRAEIAQATAMLEVKRLDLSSAQNDLDRHQIKSPTDGVIDFATFEMRPGTVVAVNSTLVEVLKIDPIQVRVDYPQERLDELAMGQEAEVVLDSFPKETFAGTVVRISPTVNSQLRVLSVLVELPNPNHRIRPGISGFARLKSRKKVVIVPATAVLEHGSKSMVFRVEEGHARVREVQTGYPAKPGELEVKSGLQPGDEVVIYHDFYPNARRLTKAGGYLQDNDPVDVNWRKWARRE
jgi:RND family efflux transporter MFP subunit